MWVLVLVFIFCAVLSTLVSLNFVLGTKARLYMIEMESYTRSFMYSEMSVEEYNKAKLDCWNSCSKLLQWYLNRYDISL